MLLPVLSPQIIEGRVAKGLFLNSFVVLSLFHRHGPWCTHVLPDPLGKLRTGWRARMGPRPAGCGPPRRRCGRACTAASAQRSCPPSWTARTPCRRRRWRSCRARSAGRRSPSATSGMSTSTPTSTMRWVGRRVEGEAVDQERGRFSPPEGLTAERLVNLRSAPRCGAKTRAGTACQGPASKGKARCRLHGAQRTLAARVARPMRRFGGRVDAGGCGGAGGCGEGACDVAGVGAGGLGGPTSAHTTSNFTALCICLTKGRC